MWVEVKRVRIVSMKVYSAVQEIEPEFARYFRSKVNFDGRFKVTAQTVQASVVFVVTPASAWAAAFFGAVGGARCCRPSPLLGSALASGHCREGGC